MFLVHVAGNILMITLDTVWWVIALSLVRKTLWRVVISAFMAFQMSSIVGELLNRIGVNVIYFPNYLPQSLNASIVIWHYLALPGLLVLGSIYGCVRLIQRKRKAAATIPPITNTTANPYTRREFIGTCMALAPSLFTFSLTGLAARQMNHFRLRRMDLSIPSLPKDLDGLTIAHVSDMHVGEWTHGPILEQMVEVTNSLKADVIAVTGDLINYELSELPEAMSLIKKMESRYGLWMVEGNHDLFQSAWEFDHRVKAAGIQLLLDDSMVTDIRGYPVQFFGLRWMDGIGAKRDRITALQMRETLKQRQPDAFPILLAHHPHAFDRAAEAGLPLTLSGHTHGGQLMLDKDTGVGPMLFRYWSGLYKKENSQLVVSNGVGNTFPVRINAPAEISHLTLHCA
jgi:predicted MPP superfamily phosphohydrolase